MSRRRPRSLSTRKRKRRPARRLRLTRRNLWLDLPFLALMWVSLIAFLAVTLYRHPTPWHWGVVALMVILAVVIVRARLRREQ